MKKVNVRTIAGFALSAFFLWLTFHKSGVEFQNLVLTVSQWGFFAASVLSLIIAVWLQSVRARLLWVQPGQKPGHINTFNSLAIGNFYNCVLPGNLGEGVRAWHFSKKNKVPFFRSLASVITEKWIDAQFFFIPAVILFFIKPFVSHYIYYAIAYTALVATGLSAVFILMRLFRGIEKPLARIALFFGKPGKLLVQLYWHINAFITTLEKGRLSIYYFLLCVSMFLMNVLQFYFLLKCTGIVEPLGSVYTAFLTAVCMIIIVFVPAAPSNIGVMHYGTYSLLILAAAQYGITPGAADLQAYARYAVYVHLSFVVPEVLMGAYFIVRERKTIF